MLIIYIFECASCITAVTHRDYVSTWEMGTLGYLQIFTLFEQHNSRNITLKRILLFCLILSYVLFVAGWKQ